MDQKDPTDFIVRPYRSKRLKSYYEYYSHDRERVVYDDNVADMLRNQGYSFEETPRSVYKVDKLYEALSGYRPRIIRAPRPSQDYEHGISLAYSCFARPKHINPLHVLPLTPDTVVKVTSNPSGSPGITSYGCTKAESMTRALERGLQTLKGIKQPEPCLAFARTQFNDKTRLVWGFPYSMTVIEGLIAYNLIQQFKGGNTPMAFAMTTVALGTKIEVASYHSKWAYSLDMSQFDATISAALIHKAFCVLRTWYDLGEVEPVSGLTVKSIFDVIEKYFIHTTIVMPDGHIYIGKDHGVPSGSYFTQMIDSIVNVIIAGAISSHFNLRVSRRELFVLGDDLLIWSNTRADLDLIAKYANEAFGVKLHGSEKSRLYHFDEAVHYLGRNWTNGLPDLDEDEILARMVYPERFRVYSKDPQRRRREVRMLLLSYAAVYRQGWKIVSRTFGCDEFYARCGCANTDVNTYCMEASYLENNPDHLSGLQRFRMKYLNAKIRGDIPITATQYWL